MTATVMAYARYQRSILVPNVTRHVYLYSREGRHPQHEWLMKPVLVDEPFDVWLEFSASDVRVFASVEPLSNRGTIKGLSENPLQQFLIGYSIQHSDGHAVRRSALWQFIEGSGLCMASEEPEHLFEAVCVSTQILGALYEGNEIGNAFPVSSAAVH